MRRHAIETLSLDALHWPLGRPDRLLEATVSEMGPQDHIVTYPTTALYLRRHRGLRAHLSIVIVEPDAIHAKHVWLAAIFFWRFHRILTRNTLLLRWIPNARLFVFGGTQIANPSTTRTDKTRHLSVIASAKRDLEGHRLRHTIIAALRERCIAADILGRGYAPFGQKEDGLAPYQYSIIIENVREKSYFTEKLVDALLCRTIPIYWGAPDIDCYFDPAGMIIVTSADEILTAAANLPEIPSPDMKRAAERNREIALRYADLDQRIAAAVLAPLKATAP
ncbi:hypothetical protein GU927_010240 [Rhodobacteraceae bacterium HSP-20]|uniref:Fucosyltransferase C-terminal domain-containing protein n=1 Tax=Paragemmobacter amnigenus TaxID=2852097 RepID=A0ABS6J3P7_9RHOB|nr:glycosyltransferase family 10 [Rhodobacter amnigenus]MBU9698223.1 hypothetical protein [Rhodobacter amnigenus]MBV4389450.1 hypothetical protein [Rhodobacter amnigenus]